MSLDNSVLITNQTVNCMIPCGNVRHLQLQMPPQKDVCYDKITQLQDNLSKTYWRLLFVLTFYNFVAVILASGFIMKLLQCEILWFGLYNY